MTNYFQLLDIEQATHIDLETLSKHHSELAAKHHPDNSEHGDDAQYRLLNTAYAILQSHSKRLIHLMELEGIPYEKRGTVSDHLMDFFMSTAQILQDADGFLRKKSATTSALAIALLENESQQLQDIISKQIDYLEAEKASTLEVASNTNQLSNAARDLAFLEKWQAQLKERYASLF